MSICIPQKLLITTFGHLIETNWSKLPTHLQEDKEVQLYRWCVKHYNQPWMRTHIDGFPPMKKQCDECRRQLAEREEGEL